MLLEGHARARPIAALAAAAQPRPQRLLCDTVFLEGVILCRTVLQRRCFNCCLGLTQAHLSLACADCSVTRDRSRCALFSVKTYIRAFGCLGPCHGSEWERKEEHDASQQSQELQSRCACDLFVGLPCGQHTRKLCSEKAKVHIGSTV